jgi:hypothetical protein
MHYQTTPNLVQKLENLGSVSKVDDLFFYKRKAFAAEKEVRFLINGISSDTLPVKINLTEVIEDLLFDPRMCREVFEKHKKFIKSLCPKMNVKHSNLYDPDRALRI